MALPPENIVIIKRAVRDILMALGENPDREGLKDTPTRVANLYDDVLDGSYSKLKFPTTFEEDEFAGAIMVHHAPFFAFCEHHLALFHGHFGMAYVPNKHILGLSKLVRMFRHCSKRLTIQERLTQDAVDVLWEVAAPQGAICYVAAEHTCMSLRGVKSPGAITTTVAYRGTFDSDLGLRQQFLNEASK